MKGLENLTSDDLPDVDVTVTKIFKQLLAPQSSVEWILKSSDQADCENEN
jgi:hypothetical protein